MKSPFRHFFLIFIVFAGTLSACDTQNFRLSGFDLFKPKPFAISMQNTIENDISHSLELLTGTPEIAETKILIATLIPDTQNQGIKNSATPEEELDVTETQEYTPSTSLSHTASPAVTAANTLTPENNSVEQTNTKSSTPTTTPSNKFTKTSTKTVMPTATLTRRPPTSTNTNTSVPENTATFTPVPPTATKASTGCDWSGNSQFESSLISFINNERTNRGLGTLSVHSSLTAAARGHSQDMACNNFFSHTGSDGSSPFSRIIAAGYNYSLASENIYAGSGSNNSASAAFTAWMNSEGHRNNMLDPRVIHIGVGYAYAATSDYGGYVTANFGVP